jgi:hypothetical protein
MFWARENHEPEIYDVLARGHQAIYPDAFDPIPASVLDQLDDPELDEFIPPPEALFL